MRLNFSSVADVASVSRPRASAADSDSGRQQATTGTSMAGDWTVGDGHRATEGPTGSGCGQGDVRHHVGGVVWWRRPARWTVGATAGRRRTAGDGQRAAGGGCGQGNGHPWGNERLAADSGRRIGRRSADVAGSTVGGRQQATERLTGCGCCQDNGRRTAGDRRRATAGGLSATEGLTGGGPSCSGSAVDSPPGVRPSKWSRQASGRAQSGRRAAPLLDPPSQQSTVGLADPTKLAHERVTGSNPARGRL